MSKALPGFVFSFIGRRLGFQRSVLGLSVADLARATGIVACRLERYESGAEPIKAHDLEVLARALGVPVQFFFEQDHGAPISLEGIAPLHLAAPSKTEMAERELGKAFAKLKNPKVRKTMLDIIKARYLALQSDQS